MIKQNEVEWRQKTVVTTKYKPVYRRLWKQKTKKMKCSCAEGVNENNHLRNFFEKHRDICCIFASVKIVSAWYKLLKSILQRAYYKAQHNKGSANHDAKYFLTLLYLVPTETKRINKTLVISRLHPFMSPLWAKWVLAKQCPTWQQSKKSAKNPLN